MKAVLGIFGIAIGFIILSMLISQTVHPGKQLTANPQEVEQLKWEAEQEKDKKKAAEDEAKQNSVKGKPADAAEGKTAEGKPQTSSNPTFVPPKDGVVTALLEIKGKGVITIDLYSKAAPKTVEHMVKLIKEGFYNNVLFHRVIPGFVAQVGDPKSKGMNPNDLKGKSDAEIGRLGLGASGSGSPVEFEPNELNNYVGTLAMALNKPQTATGDSQFFINLVYNKSLDRDYCVFGHVSTGMDVVNKLENGDQIVSFKIK
ncbi:MAG: peptidylprolyl isomerase [Chthonomonadales bacterium]